MAIKDIKNAFGRKATIGLLAISSFLPGCKTIIDGEQLPVHKATTTGVTVSHIGGGEQEQPEGYKKEKNNITANTITPDIPAPKNTESAVGLKTSANEISSEKSASDKDKPHDMSAAHHNKGNKAEKGDHKDGDGTKVPPHLDDDGKVSVLFGVAQQSGNGKHGGEGRSDAGHEETVRKSSKEFEEFLEENGLGGIPPSKLTAALAAMNYKDAKGHNKHGNNSVHDGDAIATVAHKEAPGDHENENPHGEEKNTGKKKGSSFSLSLGGKEHEEEQPGYKLPECVIKEYEEENVGKYLLGKLSPGFGFKEDILGMRLSVTGNLNLNRLDLGNKEPHDEEEPGICDEDEKKLLDLQAYVKKEVKRAVLELRMELAATGVKEVTAGVSIPFGSGKAPGRSGGGIGGGH